LHKTTEKAFIRIPDADIIPEILEICSHNRREYWDIVEKTIPNLGKEAIPTLINYLREGKSFWGEFDIINQWLQKITGYQAKLKPILLKVLIQRDRLYLDKDIALEIFASEGHVDDVRVLLPLI
jgi:hypothetical protein